MRVEDEATRIVLIRHGQTAWNVATRIQGHTDEPLNEHGRWQAAQTAGVLAGEPFSAIYSSDLKRARATADALAQRTRLNVIEEPALRERHFGCFEGASYEEIDAQWPHEALRWRRREADYAPPGGETLTEFFDRVVHAATVLAARHRGELIALVSHGGALDCLYRAALGLPLNAPRSWQIGNAAIQRLLYTGDGFSLVGWNDDAHLAPLGDAAAAGA